MELTAVSVQSAPGALVAQFLANQVQNCSLICPFVVQGAVQVPTAALLTPGAFVAQLQAGKPLVQALGLTGATVSGAADDVWTGLIRTDLDQVVPRTQFGTEVIAVGLVRVGEAVFTEPGQFPGVLGQARSDLFDALNNRPGPESVPVVHTPLEAAAVRGTEVFWAVAFHSTEQLTLVVTRVPNAFLTTLGSSGSVVKAVQATGEAVTTTVSESVAPIRDALTKPIPITPRAAAVTTDAKTTEAVTPQKKAPTVRRALTPKTPTMLMKPPVLTSKPDSGVSPTSKQPNVMRGLDGAIKKVLGDVAGKKPSAPDKPAKKATGD
ncbi:hypothetical protein [Mycobacteroides chelonae]|uniref:hypothetical protein n=1 Tax=Mycobacteroides chelonae TaxID=1774 RepID=UPI0008AA2591|nr:hypothetical protein [Mycobacteroides chelonae]OHU49513.1 hypothetical protein BKG81_16075 [Mycobacteroides chelonae]